MRHNYVNRERERYREIHEKRDKREEGDSLKFYYTFKRCVIIMSTERGRDTERYMKRETRERRVSVRTRGHV